MFCDKCGAKNEENAKFCENCGSSLPEQEIYQSNTAKKKPSSLLVILGYIFAVFGAVIGAVIGLYLFTRDDSYRKVHGRNILIISVVLLIIGAGAAAFTWQSISEQLSTFNQNSTDDINKVGENDTEDSQENTKKTQSEQSISSAQARNIAYNFAQSHTPGAKASTPSLSGNIYNVPIIGNGYLVGEVKVNAKSGQIVNYWFQEVPDVSNPME